MKNLKQAITIRLIRIVRYFKMINKSANITNEAMLRKEAKVYLVDNFKLVLVDYYDDVINKHLASKNYSMYEFRAIENIRKAIKEYK